MKVLRSTFVLLLAAFWPWATSHPLLEVAGLIHQVHAHHHHADHDKAPHHEHNSDNHDFADGGYLIKSSNSWIKRFQAVAYDAPRAILVSEAAPRARDLNLFGPAPPDSPLLEIISSWMFLLRASAEARAPSSLV